MRGRSIEKKAPTPAKPKVSARPKRSGSRAKQSVLVEPTTETPDATLEPAKKPLGFSFYSRWIQEKPDHGKLYFNLSYQVTESFRAGVDYRPLTSDFGLLANWRILSEDDHWRPAIILGTSNDDFDEVNSQSFYGTISKYLFSHNDIHFSGYAGATYIEKLNELRPVGGTVISYQDWSTTIMYSGVDTHWVLSKRFDKQTLSFVLFALDLPGLAYGTSW